MKILQRTTDGISWEHDGANGYTACKTSTEVSTHVESEIKRAEDIIRRANRFALLIDVLKAAETQDIIDAIERKAETARKTRRTKEHNKDPFGFRRDGYIAN